jgi:putative transcriptional regulator
MMESLEGHFLLALPQLMDPNFVHTVVLIVEHGELGAMGLVVNRPTSKTVAELWRQVGQGPCDSQKNVYLGGPVSGPLMAVHTHGELAETEITAGVYFAAKKNNLDQLVQQDVPFKMFIGHAGWGPGQLESEIREGAWRAIPATLDDVFDDSEDLWQRLYREVERGLLPSILGIKHVPADPSMN